MSPLAHETFAAEVRAALRRSRENVESFLALPDDAPFGDVAEGFDRLLAPLNGLEGRVHLHTQAHPDKEMRTTCEALEQEIAALKTELSLHRGVYQRLERLDPGDAGGPEERRVLEHGLRDFRRSGVDRDEETRERIRALQEELVKIGQDFDRNIVTGGRTYIVRNGHAGLAGMPQDFLDSHPERDDGTVEVSTDPADRLTMLRFAQSEDVRREYFIASMNRAVPENLEVLPRLLERRHELAGLLGYDNWADYVTGDKMVTSGAEAGRFLDRVIGLVQPRAQAEYEELLEQKRKTDPMASAVQEWDRMYLEERVRASRLGFEAQEARPYFAYDRVRDGILGTSATLYGVEFRRNEEAEVWHSAVECYDILDGGEVLARFYLDMHPRDDKYKHAAMFHLSEGIRGEVLPEAALLCNFAEPKDGDPALLVHDQVTTLFHEFGHLLHHLFGGGQRFARFSGIATEHDFVEVPSQMYEEWAWNPDVLATFATHVETGEPIPAELVGRMRAAEEYGKGLHVLGQMFFARLSLSYYDRDPEGLDTTGLMVRLKHEMLPFPHAEGNHFNASFGHLHGYSAMYYTYMWSLVIAKDLFTRFEDDMMNTATANEYRSVVLAPGGSRDAKDLVSDFLGREYGFGAFEAWLRK
ncbi:MAG: Zn-dependent oligopeptidase [Planctomycetota bacterium]|nr:Zn-dependent oligopeptidase [Planctomycetota bacterium]